MDIDNFPDASGPSAAGPSTLRKGYGRIVRDADGNIVDVELAEEDAEEIAEPALIEEIPDPSQAENAAGWIALGSSTAASGPAPKASASHVVQSELSSLCQTSYALTRCFAFPSARDRMMCRPRGHSRRKRRRGRSVFFNGRRQGAPASCRTIRTRRDCDGPGQKIKSDAAHSRTTDSGHQESWGLCGTIGQSLKHVYTRLCATRLSWYAGA